MREQNKQKTCLPEKKSTYQTEPIVVTVQSVEMKVLAQSGKLKIGAQWTYLKILSVR